MQPKTGPRGAQEDSKRPQRNLHEAPRTRSPRYASGTVARQDGPKLAQEAQELAIVSLLLLFLSPPRCPLSLCIPPSLPHFFFRPPCPRRSLFPMGPRRRGACGHAAAAGFMVLGALNRVGALGIGHGARDASDGEPLLWHAVLLLPAMLCYCRLRYCPAILCMCNIYDSSCFPGCLVSTVCVLFYLCVCASDLLQNPVYLQSVWHSSGYRRV